ncbi:MAG: ATP phosphoribosyltransferase regulatory subunit, partial [Planctomycetes bacterium]|nr:ATP phosphoribosyltransferase regulatory subunit [Planctomycetota bacterium]
LLQDRFHDSLSGMVGSRTMEEILTRFIRKLQRGDDPQRVERGISLFSRLASIKGEEDQAMPQIRSVLQEYGLSPTALTPLEEVLSSFRQRCTSVSLTVDIGLVRGIAYYTGMVFEVIAEGERTVCGGGRYDNLIELFGGPPTPAVGFGMGDVVLSLLLEDKGLMPQGKDLRDAVSRPQASVRPDAFVITADEQLDPVVKRTVATLRAGRESEAWLQRDDRKPWDADRYAAAPLHARRSYKATRHIGKLLKDAASQHARHAVIIESDQVCNVKNLDTGEQRENIALTDLPAHLA